MKKWSKLTAVLATVSMLAFGTFMSCSSGSDDEDDSPSLSVSGAISATVDGTISQDFTVKLKNDSFKSAAAAGDELSSVVTLSKSDFYVAGTLSITAKEAFAAGAKTATVTVSGTAASTAVTSTFTVTIAAAALTGGKDLTSGNVSYAITTESGGGNDTVVDAVWSLDTRPSAFSADNTDITVSSTALTADSGSGAALSFDSSDSKCKWASSAAGGYIQAGKSTSGKVVVFTLVLDAKADVTINYASANATDQTSRSFAFASATETLFTDTAFTSGTDTADGTTTATCKKTDLAAGTYTISINGSRLLGVSCTNQTFEVSTDATTANTNDVLGLEATGVASSNESVATVALGTGDNVNKIVITSVAPGSCTITLDDGAKHYATIPVTVSVKGAITLGTITKNNFVEKTVYYGQDTVAVTAGTQCLLSQFETYFDGNIIYGVSTSDGAVLSVDRNDSGEYEDYIYTHSYAAGTATITVASIISEVTYSITIAATVASDGSITFAAPVYPFVPRTDLTETLAALNLTGLTDVAYTYTPEGVVTAADDGTNVTITSVVAGASTISCTSGTKVATIAVTVDAKGYITIGTVTPYSAFAADTEVITNDVATLGLAATTASATSGTTYVSAEIPTEGDNSGKIVITSLKSGDGVTTTYEAVVTFSDGTNSGTIDVDVALDGTVTATVNKYSSTGTITLFKSTDTTYSASGVSSNTDLATCGAASFAWNATMGCSIADGYPVMQAFSNAAFTVGGTQNTSDSNKYDITGAYWKPAANSTTALAADTDAAVLTFTITAVKAITIKTISAKMGQSQTSKMESMIYYNDETGVVGLAGKDMTFSNVTLNKSLAAGATATIKVAVHNTTAEFASGKSLQVVIGDLILDIEGQ